jgi:hypothetical protein
MATPLTQEQALGKLSDIFHDSFRRFRTTALEPDEEIFAVADCSCRGFFDHGSGGFFGFLAVTSYRVFQVLFEAHPRRPRVRYYKEGEGFFYSIVSDERLIGAPSNMSLLPSEVDSRQTQDAYMSTMEDLIMAAYSGNLEGETLRSVELDFRGSGVGPDGWPGSVGLWRTLLGVRDGQAIYNLIHEAMSQGSGRIQAEISKEEALHRLERIAALYQDGMLTDEEFKAAKARLLGL